MAGPGASEGLVEAVFPALTIGGPQETHVPSGATFYVTVQVDAGSFAFGSGDAYRLHVLVKDLVSNATVVNSIANGHMNTPGWPTHNYAYTFPVAAAPNTIYQALAVITVAPASPEPAVSFLESDPIVVN